MASKPTRRGFLGALLGGFTAAAVDPEKLLWVPGRKVISIPSVVTPTLDQISVITRRYIAEAPLLIDNIFQQDPLMEYLNGKLVPSYWGGDYLEEALTYE